MAFTAATVSLLSSVGLSATAAAQSTNAVAVQAEQAALAAWHQSMRHMAPPAEGCFHVAYPSVIWEKVACGKASLSHPVLSQKAIHDFLARIGQPGLFRTVETRTAAPDGAGRQNDYVAQTSSLIQSATGSFPSVTNVTSVSTFGDAVAPSRNGSNKYTIQLNTNQQATAICKGAPPGTASCVAWEQFAYGSDGAHGETIIQNWLIGWGISAKNLAIYQQEQALPGTSFTTDPRVYGTSCPAGWTSEYLGCMKMTLVRTPGFPISNLADFSLKASANPNGDDEVQVAYGKDIYSATEPDSTLDISSGWSQSEFNVVGDGGSSQANFNPGASITVKLAVNDGSGLAPTCLGPSGEGYSGETNNLTLGKCMATAGATVPTATGYFSTSPYIQFTESN